MWRPWGTRCSAPMLWSMRPSGAHAQSIIARLQKVSSLPGPGRTNLTSSPDIWTRWRWKRTRATSAWWTRPSAPPFRRICETPTTGCAVGAGRHAQVPGLSSEGFPRAPITTGAWRGPVHAQIPVQLESGVEADTMLHTAEQRAGQRPRGMFELALPLTGSWRRRTRTTPSFPATPARMPGDSARCWPRSRSAMAHARILHGRRAPGSWPKPAPSSSGSACSRFRRERICR